MIEITRKNASFNCEHWKLIFVWSTYYVWPSLVMNLTIFFQFRVLFHPIQRIWVTWFLIQLYSPFDLIYYVSQNQLSVVINLSKTLFSHLDQQFYIVPALLKIRLKNFQLQNCNMLFLTLILHFEFFFCIFKLLVPLPLLANEYSRIFMVRRHSWAVCQL